ncbi:MAG TPA: DUF1684 domain-containing protein [Chitinophagaceae bacterium]|nr:DUF1684 domain-containing protein [Chitinophagaceae bacterium]
MNNVRGLLVLLMFCVLLAFNVGAQANAVYKKEIDDWHSQRIADLKADDGWLNLIGLFWLDEGKNSFGSDSSNDIVFPPGTVTKTMGYFERTGNSVKMVITENGPVYMDSQRVKDAVIFTADMQNVPVVSCGSLRWIIIKRDDKIGVRLRDINSKAPAAFTGVDRFPVDSTWRIPAMLQKPALPSTIAITNIIGQTTKQASPGKLVFSISGKQYTLDAMEEGDELFIVFGDATSGITTYPSGRFVYTKKPGANGLTMIDFNKAYNPPCAFTDYATCPLPPRQNILPVAVTAGEKNYGTHHR